VEFGANMPISVLTILIMLSPIQGNYVVAISGDF